jgi:hypothetical protein
LDFSGNNLSLSLRHGAWSVVYVSRRRNCDNYQGVLNLAATDIAQTNLREPDQVDWDSAFKGSSYNPPPPAIGPDGKPIVYQGILAEAKESPGRGLDEGYLNYQIDLKIRGAGSADGTTVRTWASTRTFQKRNKDTGELEAVKGNPNALAKFVNAAGVQAKPKSNAEYRAAVKAINGRPISFTIDWEARNTETGESVKGYLSFPDDPERPGQKKSILRKGDLINVLDSTGAVIDQKPVVSDVLFANARIKYFQNPTPTVRK